MGPYALAYLYRNRLRVHAAQELLAGLGIAVAVALVSATLIANGSISGSAREVVHTVIGPANLQVRTRGPEGFSEALLAQVERLPGVKQAAPLLEETATLVGPSGRHVAVYLAGADLSLATLDGLAHTIPRQSLSADGISLSTATATALQLPLPAGRSESEPALSLQLRGRAYPRKISAVLGKEAAGALAGARIAVMPLADLQTLAGQRGLVSRILIETKPGAEASVRKALAAMTGGRLTVARSDQDLALLHQALGASDEASGLFAAISALLGFLFAFNAILLTVPERRQAIADLRLSGTRRGAIVQLAMFQALCLGAVSSGVGLAAGYALARWVFQQSTGYLTEAFTLTGGTVVEARSVLVAGVGGVLVTCVASALPLADLRAGRPPDAIYMHTGVPGNALTARARRWLPVGALALLGIASTLYAAAPASALFASAALALATVLAVPVAFALVLAASRALSARAARLSTLALALAGLRGASLRALALAATGAVALFGGVALGGARANLVDGIRGFAHSYAADAPVWVSEPDDNQATQQLAGDGGAGTIGRVSGVASVERFQGAFLTFGPRRVWVIARPSGGAANVLASQTLGAASAAAFAGRALAQGGWIAVSQQIAAEHHAHVGGTLTLPTPAGQISYRIAALTTNLAWSPGVVFMSSRDFTRAWRSSTPSALAVRPAPDTNVNLLRTRILAALGPDSGLEVATAATREARIDALTSEGLSQLGTISTLMLVAAILALGAALTSGIHQRRGALAELRLTGAPSARLRRILLTEAVLMLGAGCLTGALAGFYGQFVIDAYLREVTGFPVLTAGASPRPFEVLAVVLLAALALVAIPGWLASRVPVALALAED
jgi:putative ABC transport system permease protein